jgi:hypothetical protein
MAPRAKQGLLIGYIHQRGRLFWIWLPEKGRIIKASAVKFRESDTDGDDKIGENVEYEAVLDDPTVYDILQDPGATTTGITTQPDSCGERDRNQSDNINKTPIPTIEQIKLTRDKSDDTVPFPTPEQTPDPENSSDNYEDSIPDKPAATERLEEQNEGRKYIQGIRDEEIAEDEFGILSNKYIHDSAVREGTDSRTVS